MTISTSDQKDFETSLLDYAKAGKESLEAWVKGANMGQHEPNDDQFKLWFETTAGLHDGMPVPGRTPEQIDWLRALQCRKATDPSKPAVEGADQMLTRYQRVLTKGMDYA